MKINLVLMCLSLNPLLSAHGSWECYKEETLKVQKNIDGWCSEEKASLLMDYIYYAKPSRCVEIGTYLGATTYPIAKAIMFNNKGLLYTIDTWDYSTPYQKAYDYDIWANVWKQVNFNGEEVYVRYIASHFKKGLKGVCYPIRTDSVSASPLFGNETIDFLFLDGEIATDVAMKELLLYFPKVKLEGAIYLNRADITAKAPLVKYLMAHCRYEKKWSHGIETVLFIKTKR